MKNQIDQSTPFLAFYDLLRIRGIYSDEEKREKLRRGFRRAMALAAVLVGLLVPHGARASVLGDLAENGVISPGSHRDLPGGDDNPLLANGDALKIGTDGKGNALFQTRDSWKTTGGSLTGGLVYLLAKGGISFEGGSFNVDGLVAAAIGKSEFRLGDKLVKSDVTGDISGSAGGNGFRVYVGKTVGASGGTIVATEGMSDGASFTISGSNGGTITFSGDVGSGTLKARTVNFDDGSSTSGSVTAEDGSVQVGDAVAGSRQDEDGNDVETLSFNQNAERSMTQNAGTISASTISGAIDQKAGSINAGSTTATLNVGAGSTLGAGSVTAGTVTVGSDGSGALTLAGNELSGKTINAGAVTLAGATGGLEYNVSGNISSIGTSGNAAGKVTVNNGKALTLGTINASSLEATASGNITQSGVTTLSGTGDHHVTLDAGANAITLSQGVSGAGTLTLKSNATAADAVKVSGGNVSAQSVSLGGSAKTLTQSGGTISVSGGTFLSGADIFAQTGGTLSLGNSTANTVASTVKQTGTTAEIKNTAGSLAFGKAFTPSGTGANLVQAQQGKITVGGSGSLSLAGGDTLAGNVTATEISGNFTQADGTITATTVAGTVKQNDGIIQANNSTAGLTLSQAITTQKGTLSGNGGDVTVANGSTLSGTVNAATLNGNFTQEDGTITATKVAGTVTQNDGIIQANDSATGLTLSQAITTQKGTLSGNYGDVVLEGGGKLAGKVEKTADLKAGTEETPASIEQSAGSIVVTGAISADTFTQSGTSTVKPEATAAVIAANVSQTGNGTITATTSIGDAENAKTVTQSGAGLIKTDHVYGAVSQGGSGAAKLQANTANGTLVLDGNVTQNNANATIGTTSTGVTVNQGFTQTNGKGKIAAETLTLNNAANDYKLESTGNNVAILTGSAKSIEINDAGRTGTLTLSSLSVGTGDGNTVKVTKAADVELAGVTAKEITIQEATGAVTDTSDQSGIATTVKLGDATHSVGSATFDETKTLTLNGVNASGAVTAKADTSLTLSDALTAGGDVAISTASFTQGGKAVKGQNVTILDSKATGLTVNGNITATGDILVEATGGKLTVGAATLDAQGTIANKKIVRNGQEEEHAFGNIVLQGKDVVIGGTDADHKSVLKAKTGVGIAATDVSGRDNSVNPPTYANDKGTLTIGAHTDIVAPKVVATSYGDLTIADGARMGATSAEAQDAVLTVFTENKLSMSLAENKRPTKIVRIASAKSMDADLTQEITLGQFAINADSLPALTFSADTERISIESSGDVNVTTKGDITIFNNAEAGESDFVSAVNVADVGDSPVTVEAGVSPDKAAHGLVGKKVTFVAGGAVTVEDKAVVSSTDNKLVIDTSAVTTGNKFIDVQEGSTVKSVKGVELKSGGELTVAGTVLDRADAGDAAGGGIELSSAAGSDVTVSGTVDAKGALKIDSGKDVSLSGTVKTGGDTLSITAENGINQTGGTVTANKADAVSTLTAKNGGITLDQPGNDFDTVKAAATGGSISLADKKDLTLSEVGTTATGEGSGISVSAGGKLTVAGAVTAPGAVTLEATDTMNDAGQSNNDAELDASAEAATITSTAGSVTAKAAGNAKFGEAVKGTSVDLSTTDGGTIEAAAVTATGGDAKISAAGKLTQNGNVASTGGNALLSGASVEAIGTVQANNGNARIASTAGTVDVNADVTAKNVTVDATGGKVTLDAALTASDGDAYVHTTVGGIDVNAKITADNNIVLKAEAGETMVAESEEILTAKGVGIQGGTLSDVKDSQFSGTTDLALVATAGGATLTQVPADVQNVGIAVSGGDLVVETEGDATFNGATVNANAVDESGGTTVQTVRADGLSASGAGSDVTVTVKGGSLSAANVTAGGDATVVTDENANGGAVAVGNVTAGGQATVRGTTVDAGNVAGGTGTEVTARTGGVNAGDIGNGGATTVTAPGAVNAGNVAGGTADVVAGGNIAAASIAGAGGTTVTAQNGGAIAVAGAIGQGGATTVEANGASVTAGTLASGGLLDVNNAGAVNANVAAGGDAQIQAASLAAGNTQAGGNLTFDTVAGAADVGTMAVGGDVNGTVGGLFTTAGGAVGSIGQQGGFNAPGGATVNGNLNSGPVLANTGAFTVNGALNAGGSPVVLNTAATTLNGGLTGGNVTINAGGPVTGGGALAAGQLNIAAGGSEINLPNVQSANLNNITGGNITLTDTTGQQITIGTINAGGVLDLTLNSAAGTAGGGNLTANGTMTLTVNGPFGTIAAPVVITINGGNPVLNIDGSGIDGSLLHFILNGELNPGDILVNYLGEGFAIYGSQQAGWQIIGIGPEKQRLLNRALAFTVNTPELKSKQGIFGDPAMLHTRMNVSEARPGANMDMLALAAGDFSGTWREIEEQGTTLGEWRPAVNVDEAPLLDKLESIGSDIRLQPEVQPARRTGAEARETAE